MGSFFGAVAQAKVEANDKRDAATRARQQEMLKLALLARSENRDQQSHEATMLRQGFLPVGTTGLDGANPVRVGGYQYHPEMEPGARQDAAKRTERESFLRDYSAKQPRNRQLSEAMINLLSRSETMFNAWGQRVTGSREDPIAVHRANRDYDAAHPVGGENGIGTRAAFTTVQQQVTETRDDLRRARASKAPGPLSSGLDSATYNAAQSRIPALQSRVDSLSAVRDRRAAQVQGVGPAPTTPVRPSPAKRDTVQGQDEYDHLRSIGMTDQDIASRYAIVPAVRRK